MGIYNEWASGHKAGNTLTNQTGFGQNVHAVNVGVVDPRIFCDVVPLPTSAHPQSNQIRTSMRGQTAVTAGLEGNLLLLSVCMGTAQN